MSRDRKHLPGRMVVADDAVPRAMVLTGLVRTSKGYATAVAEVAADGTLTLLKVGPSQSEKRFEAISHKRVMVKAALDA